MNRTDPSATTTATAADTTAAQTAANTAAGRSGPAGASSALGGGCTVAMIFASVFAALAVGLGAFGAHALKPRLLEAGTLDIWKTAVDYQMWHALALLGLGVWVRIENSCAFSARRAIAVLWVVGIVLFSGSLYALALGAPKVLGAVTPLGGVAFILGWLLLALSGVRLLRARKGRRG